MQMETVYGTVDDEGKVSVAAICEPQQVSSCLQQRS